MSGTIAGLGAAIIGDGTVGGSFARFLRPASIRGVGFWILAADDSTARRWVTHEFPLRDEPWHEDLGLGAAAFAVDGLLIGDDVVRQAERLRGAARAAGAARLVHPWYGTLQVVVLRCDLSFSTAEGRVARFRLQLERFGPRAAPGLVGGLAARVLDAIDTAADAVSSALAEIRGLVALPDQAISAVLGIGTSVAGLIERGVGANGLATVLGSTLTGQALAGLAGLSAADATSTGVADQARAIAAAIAALPPAAGAVPNAPLGTLLGIAEDAAALRLPTDRSTPAAVLVADVAAELAVAIRAAVVAEAARAALAAGWASRDDALADRERLSGVAETVADAVAELGWDDAWRALVSLRAAIVAEISARAAPLPRLRRIAIAAPLPASLVAYALDPTPGTLFARGDALAARNRAARPGFLPADRPIEVLV